MFGKLLNLLWQYFFKCWADLMFGKLLNLLWQYFFKCWADLKCCKYPNYEKNLAIRSHCNDQSRTRAFLVTSENEQ